MYILIKLCLQKFPKKFNIFLYKTYFLYINNAYIGTRLLRDRYLATGEIFENMLQLMRFGLNFEGIENGHFHIEIMMSATEMLGGSGACSPRKC